MAEFLEVMTTATRMCKADILCKNCPLSGRAFCVKKPDELKREDFELAEEIIMKWDKEHLVKTNADKFEEVFGFRPVKNKCIKSYKCSECEEYGISSANCMANWWNKEYKAPTEEVSE